MVRCKVSCTGKSPHRDVDGETAKERGGCGWHGYITNGSIRTV